MLAVSGGTDSTALLYVIKALKTENILSADIVCAHINHQLRPTEADLDELFVIDQSKNLNLPITTRSIHVRNFATGEKLSIETAARKLRIQTLLEIAKENDCNTIVTAHQKNDNAETILQRLHRGTGFRGLAGIWPMRVFDDDIRFVRPLLCVNRDEINQYLKQRNLKWRQDHTNADCTYRRNFIRHRLLPALQKDCTDSLVEQLFDLAESARKFYSLVCSRAEIDWPKLADYSNGTFKLNLQMFLSQHPAVKVELIRRSLTALASGEKDLTHQHYERILQLAVQNVGGSKIDLPAGFVVRREYGNLIFTRPEESQVSDKQISESAGLNVPGQAKFSRYLVLANVFDADKEQIQQFKAKKTNSVEWFDLDKVKLPLVIRFRQSGDRFWPLGLPAEKKVGKFLTAAKVSQTTRRNLLIVADTEKIIWVWPVRMSEKTKITNKTKKILQLQITDTNSA